MREIRNSFPGKITLARATRFRPGIMAGFKIGDSGGEIPAEDLLHVFDRFCPVEKS